MKKISLVLLLIVTSCIAAESPFILKGILLDSLFYGKDSLTAELLESGDTITVSYGMPFSLSLPEDVTWNFCIRSDSIEQCYIITRKDTTDAIITDSLINENRFEVFSRFVTKTVSPDTATVPDSLLPPPEDTIAVDEQVSDIVTQLRPVVIQVRKRPKRRIGQSTVSSKSIERQPGLAEADVIKAIQALPGVVASSDFSSKIYVRGGGADQNLFLFDNGVVYSPIHFFGLFSTFLVDGIESVDFYKGGFSPVYGNRLSSVVDIKSRKGGKKDNDTLTLKGAAQLTTFASTLTLEGSKKAFRFNVSGRSTYIKEALALLREIEATDIDIDYQFYDLQGNMALQLTENQSITVSGYTGKDKLVFNPVEVNWGNTVVPVNYTWKISDALIFTASAAYSHFDQDFSLINLQSFTNSIMSVGVKPLLKYTGIPQHVVTAGIESQYLQSEFGTIVDIVNFDYLAVDKFMLHSLLLEDRITFGDLECTPGIRGNYFSSLQLLSAEPRLSLSYSFTPEQRLEAHAGFYQQYINSIIFADFETLNEFYYPAGKETLHDIYPAHSLLFSLGYTTEELFKKYDVIIEGYYKTLNNLYVFDMNSPPDSIRNDPNSSIGDFIYTGEGYSLGAEISVRKNTGILSGGFSYSFGIIVQKAMKQVYRAIWEVPHSFKLDGSILWCDPDESAVWKSKKWYLRSSVQFKYSTGLPYTETTGYLPTYYMQQGEGVIIGPTPTLPNNIATPLGSRNATRVPDYARFDIKLIDWGRTDAWNFSWTILNIFNRENVYRYFNDTSERPPERITIPQFTFFPILFSYKRYF